MLLLWRNIVAGVFVVWSRLSARCDESALAPGFENGNCDGVGQVKAALAGLHGQTQTLRGREFAENRGGQAAGFAAEDENIVAAEHLFERGVLARGGHCPAAAIAQRGLAGAPVHVAEDAGVFVVVKAGAAQGLVVDVETERFDEVEFGAGIGAQPDDVAGIGGDFRLKEDDGDHGRYCSC